MTEDAISLTPEQREALDTARDMACAGIPLFLAMPDPNGNDGFRRPNAWQNTIADPTVVDRWRPGMALCAVMGHGMDLLDLDPRNGGDVSVMNGSTPVSYGVASTPSGGLHSFIRSLGAGSHDKVWPGIDVKGGMPDGSSRGFAYIAPTVKPSKVTGEPTPYRWITVPDLARLREATNDHSGAKLAERIREVRSSAGVRKLAGPEWWQRFLTNDEPQSQAAAERAITTKLTDVAEWVTSSPHGFRTTLMRAAITCGGYVGGGYLDEEDARARLSDAVSAAWGAPDDNDLLWIDQGLTDGQTKPFYVYTPADELAWEQGQGPTSEGVSPAIEPPWTIYTAIGLHPFDPTGDGSDQGLAEAVAQRMYPGMRFGVDSGGWLIRGRQAWTEREDMSGWAVATVARLMPMGATPIPKEVSERTEQHWQAHRRGLFMSSAGASRVERKLRAVVRNHDHPAGIEVAHLDGDPEVLWAGGLPWNLRASLEMPTIAEIDPATPHLHTAACLPEVAPTPLWDRFLACVWPDPEVRSWALRVLSVALAGYPDAALPVLYGPERNGKSSVVDLLMDCLGTYGVSADPKLLAGVDNAHASIVYALRGARLAFIDEGPRRGHLAQERLKQLTGGTKLTGNRMRGNPVTFRPTHTLVMTTNDEPPVTDPALRARMRIIPCDGDKVLVRAARQALVGPAWTTEMPGVLASMMTQCAAWLADRDSAATTAAPASIQSVAHEMAEGQDPVGEWVDNCTVPTHPGTQARALYRAFQAWHDLQPGLRRTSPPSETAFGRRLTELGYPVIENQGPRSKQRFRPLSVMNGSPGASVAPTPPQGHAPMVTPTVAASSDPQPSAPENASSDSVFSSFADSSDSTSSTTTTKNTHTPKRSSSESFNREIGDKPSTVGKTELQNGPDQAKAPLPVVGADSRQPGATSATGHDQQGGQASSLSATEGPLHPERTEVARRADEAKISKAEARAALKAEQRAEAVREASGEHIGFPAVVDRIGNVLPVTPEQATSVVRTALERTGGALTVDVETSGYPVGHNLHVLRSVQLGDEVAAVVLDPDTHGELIRTLLAEASALHAHSATADLVPLAHAGLIDAASGWDRMYDTVIPAKLGDPTSTGSDPALKQLAGTVLGDESTAPAAEAARIEVFKAGRWITGKQRFAAQLATPLERNGWANIDPGCEVMLRYAASDVLDTAALARRMPPVEPAVLHRERVAEEMTARVAHRGLAIDRERLAELTDEHTRARAEAKRLAGEWGIENPGSGAQVAEALTRLGAGLPVSEKGNPSVAEHVLSTLVRSGPQTDAGRLAQVVLDFRHAQTVLGLFLAPYTALCEHGDGRMRPTVYTLGTDTGRMSAVRPNVQQLPRSGGVRSVVTADPGQVFISADFSGVELRGAAGLSQDPAMIHMIAEEDAGRFDGFHWQVARQAFGPDATKEDRYVAKRGCFGTFYGGGAEGLAKQVGVPVIEMEAIRSSLRAVAPNYFAWADELRRTVRRGQTQFMSYSGRVIHFPFDTPHKAPAYAIQGSCRELLVDALLRWRDTRWGNAVLLPVHDELIVQVPAEDADEATRELVRCMQGEFYGVRIIADPDKPDADGRYTGSPFWTDST